MSKKQPNGVFQNFKIALFITIAFIVALIAWAGISSWIKNKEEEDRDNRLDEVLYACDGKENSSKCLKLQKKYNITFKYCKSVLDSVEDQYKIVYLPDGSTTLVANPIWHAVVWEGSSPTPPKNKSDLFQIYKDCADHIDN